VLAPLIRLFDVLHVSSSAFVRCCVRVQIMEVVISVVWESTSDARARSVADSPDSAGDAHPLIPTRCRVCCVDAVLQSSLRTFSGTSRDPNNRPLRCCAPLHVRGIRYELTVSRTGGAAVRCRPLRRRGLFLCFSWCVDFTSALLCSLPLSSFPAFRHFIIC
jgi:hypothetical protein